MHIAIHEAVGPGYTSDQIMNIIIYALSMNHHSRIQHLEVQSAA